MPTLQTPALRDLIMDVRSLLNEREEGNSFWTDAEITSGLQDGVNLYFTEVAKRAEGQFDATVALDLVSGTEEVALPSNCYSVRALYKKRSQGYDILPYDNNLTAGYSTASGGGTPNTYTPSYFFRGNSIVLRAKPDFSETGGLQLDYTTFPDTMITGGDTLTAGISPIFKELVVMYGVWKCKLKEDLVTGGSTADKAYLHLSNLVLKFKETVGGRSVYPAFTKPFNP